MKFLIVDSDPAERSLTIGVLRSRFVNATFVEAGGKEEFEAAVAQAGFDLAIIEQRLDWADGLHVLKELKSNFSCIPVIMLTAFGSEELAIEGMKAGLADYIPKHRRQYLADAVDKCLLRLGLHSYCMESDHLRLCRKWDMAISRLTSDFAYSLRVEPDGRFTCEWVTEPYTRITGYSPQEAASSGSWLVPVHPDDMFAFRRRIENLIGSGEQDVAEYRFITKHGETLWLCDHALPVRDKTGGRVIRIYGAAQDITRRRMAEDKLHLMQRALDSSNNGIIITGPAEADYPIRYANPAFRRITGYSDDELVGRNPRFLQSEDRGQPALEELRAALRENREGYAVLRNYRKDGSLFWNEVYLAPVTDEEGKTTNFVGIQNDVTQRVQMESQLWKSESKTRSILEHVLDGIITINEDGVIESFNPAAEKIFGYAAAEVVGRNVNMLMPEPYRSQHDTYLANYLDTGKPKIIGIGREVAGLKKNGQSFPIELGGSEVESDQHRIFIGVIHDLTERKRTEEALHELSSHLQSAREGERTRIAREIHDELGSLLTALKMDMSWLAKRLPRERGTEREKVASMNRLIDEAIQTVRKITTDLRPSILDNLGLLAAIEWLAEQFSEHSGIKCELSLPPETAISLDNDRATAVFRILQEALTNITLHSGATQASVKMQAEGGELVMKIDDNGRGTTARQLTSLQSFGILGMHERARHFGGAAQITSQPSVGTTIVVHMPLGDQKKQKQQ